MSRYPQDRRKAVLKKLLPPYSRSVAEVAKEEGIHEATLYNWKKALRESGAVVPDSNTSSDQWSGKIRNCEPIGEVHLNSEKEAA